MIDRFMRPPPPDPPTLLESTDYRSEPTIETVTEPEPVTVKRS